MSRKNKTNEDDRISAVMTANDLLIKELKLDHRHEVMKLHVQQEQEVAKLNRQLRNAEEKRAWSIESAINTACKKFEDKATKADLARVDAEARLSTYEKFDAKDERKSLQTNFDKLIASLAKSIEQIPETPDITINNEGTQL